MDNGWEASAQAWVGSIGERGDWGREHVLDPVMLGRITGRSFKRALDIGFLRSPHRSQASHRTRNRSGACRGSW